MGKPVTNYGRVVGAGIHERGGYESPGFSRTGIADKKRLLKYYENQLEFYEPTPERQGEYITKVRELRNEIRAIEKKRK